MLRDVVASPARLLSLDPDDLGELTAEASAAKATSQRFVDDRCFLDARGRVRTARRFSSEHVGAALQRMHVEVLRSAVSALLGDDAHPTRANYLFYAPGDYIGPHHDVQQCQYTVIVPLGSDSELTTYDGSRSAIHPSELFRRFVQDPSEGASEIRVPLGSAVVFAGDEVLHARRPRPEGTVSVSFCYGLV